VFRLNADGTLDPPSFVVYEREPNDALSDVEIQKDGGILVVRTPGKQVLVTSLLR
jgi:hypothetical protein